MENDKYPDPGGTDRHCSILMLLPEDRKIHQGPPFIHNRAYEIPVANGVCSCNPILRLHPLSPDRTYLATKLSPHRPYRVERDVKRRY